MSAFRLVSLSLFRCGLLSRLRPIGRCARARPCRHSTYIHSTYYTTTPYQVHVYVVPSSRTLATGRRSLPLACGRSGACRRCRLTHQSQKRFRSVILSHSRGNHRIPRRKLGLGRSNNIPHFLLSVTGVTLTEVANANFFAGRLGRVLTRCRSTTRCCTRQL